MPDAGPEAISLKNLEECGTPGVVPHCMAQKKSSWQTAVCQELRRTAATYSPNWCVSTIGADELNGSVRDGKRWILIALTTAIFYLRDYTLGFDSLPLGKSSGY